METRFTSLPPELIRAIAEHDCYNLLITCRGYLKLRHPSDEYDYMIARGMDIIVNQHAIMWGRWVVCSNGERGFLRHRIGKPACLNIKRGKHAYMMNGYRHRDHHPAIITRRHIAWYRNDVHCNPNGPVTIYADGRCKWCCTLTLKGELVNGAMKRFTRAFTPWTRDECIRVFLKYQREEFGADV